MASGSAHDPALVFSLQILQEKRFTKGVKWRDVIGALFPASEIGRPRLEIYSTPQDLNNFKPNRVIPLDDCVSIRVIPSETPEQRFVRLQNSNGSSVDVKAENIHALRTELSRVAFPDQFVAIRASSTFSPSDSPTTPVSPCATPQSIHIDTAALLLKRVGNVSEGSVCLSFKEKLRIYQEDICVEEVEFDQIVWIATGDHALGFETHAGLLYEFKCVHPNNFRAVDAYRDVCKVRVGSHRPESPTQNFYLRFYWFNILRSEWERQQIPSQSSTMEDDSCGYRDGVLVKPLFAAVTKNPEPLTVSPQPEERKEKKSGVARLINKITSPFQKKKEQPPEIQPRSNFEETDTDWTRLMISPASPGGTKYTEVVPVKYAPDEVKAQYNERPNEEYREWCAVGVCTSSSDATLHSVVSRLQPASRTSIATSSPLNDASRISRVSVLQSTYID